CKQTKLYNPLKCLYPEMSFTCPQPPLVQAIFSGDPDEIRMLIYKSEDINALDTEKRTPLHAAAFLGDAEITELLILSGRARVNAKDNMWLTPLHRAVASRSEEAVSVLIRHSADVNARDKNWQTPLHVAAANKALRCAELLIPLLSSVNVSDRGGRSALHHAALNGHTEMVSLLLAKGANINAFDKRDSRALHWAAYTGHLDVVCLLVDQGAEVSCKDKRGYTPLHAAASSGQISVVKHLLSLSVEVDEANAFGNTALHVACFNGQDAVVSELIDFGANVSQPNNKGFTPLHFAAASTHGALCLEFLVNNGADVNVQVRPGRGWTCNPPASAPSLDLMVWTVLDFSECSLLSQSRDGKSPLHMTAVHGRFTRSQTLIQNGGEIDCVDKDGNTPLHIAARYGHELLINTLITSGADCTRCLRLPLRDSSLEITGQFCAFGMGAAPRYQRPHFFAINTPMPHNDRTRGPLPDFPPTQPHLHSAEVITGQFLLLKYAPPAAVAGPKAASRACVRVSLRGARLGTARHETLRLLALALCVFCTNTLFFPSLHLPLFCFSPIPRSLPLLGLPLWLSASLLGEGGASSASLHPRSGRRYSVTCPLSNASALCAGFQIDTPDSLGRTCLHAAAAGGNVECVKLLLSSGADHNRTDRHERTPLHYAAASRHFQCLETLVSCGTCINATDQWGRCALHYAAASDLDRRRRVALEPESPGVQVEKEKEAALCLEFLLKNGATALQRDKQGYNPVHYAAAYGHRQCLELLLVLEESRGDSGESSGTWSPLHLAAYHGQAQALELLLQGHCEVERCDEVGRTALALACLRGHADCTLTLLNHGASVHSRDMTWGRTPVHLAAMNGHTSCLRLLLEDSDSADMLDAADSQGRTPLMLAVLGGHVDAVSLLLERETSVDTADHRGLTALHLGLLGGQEECVQCLLEQETSVLLGDSRGRTALHLAAARGHASWLSELLSIVCAEPPVPQLRDRQGYTPLHWACYNGHESCVEVLLEQTGSRCLDGNPFTPLHCAVVNDHEACATLLLEALGSEIVTCKDFKDRTPLHAAAFAGRVDCVQLLLAHDAPVDAVDQSGRTALMMAAERGAVGAVEALLTSASADLGLTDQKGNTALHLACSNGKEECAVLILENLRDAALVNATNAALQTPLHLAGRGGLKQVVKELLSRGASVQAVDENGLTPALACAPSREVADCLALILATMMHFCSPCSSGAPSPGDLLRSLPRYRKGPHGPQSPRDPSGPSSEGTPTENDSDSETF
ncbi:hypothetical protein P4O66_008163, partial [Electrophorus voltai]